jgi:hypothetical protein
LKSENRGRGILANSTQFFARSMATIASALP